MKRVFLLAAVYLLIACGASVSPPQTLEAALVQDGDFPDGYTAGQVLDGSTLPGYANGFTKRIARSISGPDTAPAYVMVMVYTDKARQDNSFHYALPGVTNDGQSSDAVGDRAQVARNVIVFTRCHALVQVQIGDPDQALRYAKRLDERIKSFVC